MTEVEAPEATSLGVVIVGAGGFGREVLQYLDDTFVDDRRYAFKGFLDDDPPDLAPFGLAGRVLGDTRSYDVQTADRFVIAVGEPAVRLRLAERLRTRGARFLSVVHPRAFVAASATIGDGCIVAPFATVGAHATIGAHAVLTFYASVGHDARVGDVCVLSPHSVANGGSVLGDGAFLGAHAVVNPLQRIGEGAKVAAGAIVYRNVPPRSLASGNPARSRPLW